jgi:succinate dehydrogenase / fumarate reductase flavoprotein subunit
MYNRITDEDPYKTPMMIYPAVHYTMGGLWVDYNLMTTIPGLYAIGECNFSDHGANRLGASALMQGLADGYFVIPYTLGEYLAGVKLDAVSGDHEECRAVIRQVQERTDKLLAVKGSRTVDSLHRELGMLMLDECGMSRTAKGLTEAIDKIRALKAEFWSDVRVTGEGAELNQELEKAGRVADFFELAELMCRDALKRNESCGGHFREEYQTEEGEALRDDENCTNVTVWEYAGEDSEPIAHIEDLVFETVQPTQRSYK